MIYGLRRYDVDRCAALVEPGVSDVKIQGFMSHKAKIYLVRDLFACDQLYEWALNRPMYMIMWSIYWRVWILMQGSQRT